MDINENVREGILSACDSTVKASVSHLIWLWIRYRAVDSLKVGNPRWAGYRVPEFQRSFTSSIILRMETLVAMVIPKELESTVMCRQ